MAHTPFRNNICRPHCQWSAQTRVDLVRDGYQGPDGGAHECDTNIKISRTRPCEHIDGTCRTTERDASTRGEIYTGNQGTAQAPQLDNIQIWHRAIYPSILVLKDNNKQKNQTSLDWKEDYRTGRTSSIKTVHPLYECNDKWPGPEHGPHEPYTFRNAS